ncbi:AraC family transcriptional regulator [Paenibacillus sp. GCM10012307]|uniref:AraC family transcriptional regulator n=1 Tax=Paenibacillus roseus TaxID=2798579 RepID=A0A934J1A2_9BACL|nr:AraC family transcriptional regulator [Paenibacillus roseus]MBJ6362972.1 AraC family transcriptional regulator [Paenibacillus roseus]
MTSRLQSGIYLFSSVRKRTCGGGARTFRVTVHVLCFVTEGEGVIRLDGVLSKIRPMELYLLVPGMVVELPHQSDGFVYYGVFFQPVTLLKRDGEMTVSPHVSLSGGFLPGRVRMAQPEQILQAILHMHDSSRARADKDGLQLRLQLEQLIHRLIKSEPAGDQRGDDRIDRSIAYMERHYSDKISIAQIAEAAGMNTAAYSGLFRKQKGQTPVEYLNEIRINKAKELLSLDHSRVKEVASLVGFNSEFYFSRTFQRVVGVPPKLYTRRKQMKVAVVSSLGFEQYLHDIGVNPVCAVDFFHYPGVEQAEYKEFLRKQWEGLVQSAPDLIIADEYHSNFREGLKEIAPSVVMDLPSWDWRRNFMKIAGLLGREEEAREALARLVFREAEVKQEFRQRLGERRITLIQVNHRAVGIQGTGGHPLNELIYGRLGLSPGLPAVTASWRSELLPESMPELDTELLLIHKHHVLAGSETIYKRLLQSVAWAGIPAVRDGAVYQVENWFAMSWTPSGRHYIMDKLLELCN